MTLVEFWESFKVVLAFLTRTSALIVLLLLYIKFAQAKGPFARYFKHAFASLVFLLLWVWVASVAELVRFIRGASAAVELSSNLIFIPNLVITIWLGRLLWKFSSDDEDEYDGQP